MRLHAASPAVTPARAGVRLWSMRYGLPALIVWVGAGGCGPATTPGDLSLVQAVAPADATRTGNVYLLRGWMGVFSEGIDTLAARLRSRGLQASVYLETQSGELGEKLVAARLALPPERREPLVLIGHSYGADGAIAIARRLDRSGLPVDLLVTLDPCTPPRVPGNVRLTYNLYQSNGAADALPFFRGVPLEADGPPGRAERADGPATRRAIDEATAARVVHRVLNMDLRRERSDLLTPGLDHFNIDKSAPVQAEIVALVERVCRPREVRP